MVLADDDATCETDVCSDCEADSDTWAVELGMTDAPIAT